MGLIQNIVVGKQMQGEIPTFCKKCRQQVKISEFSADGSYTKRCSCGCEVNQFHTPDKFHETPFYTKLFISSKDFIKNYKRKDSAELCGFTKVESTDGSVKYVK